MLGVGDEELTSDGRTVSFRPCLSLVEFDHFSGADSDEENGKERRIIALKSVRNRMPTSWVAPMPADARCVRFVENLPGSGAQEDGHRTGWTDTSSTRSNAESETSTGSSANIKNSRGVEGSRWRGSADPDECVSDAETVSSASSRNPRSRMSTPFVSAASWGYEIGVPLANEASSEAPATASTSSARRRPSKQSVDAASRTSIGTDVRTDLLLIKQVSIESNIEREITERVKLNAQRQAREDRFVRMGGHHADANLPLALERCSSIDEGNPEAELAKHIVPDAVKDTELLRNTFRKLAFFETFDDDALNHLIEAMEVYEFEDGEKVVRQGDTDGTHFFVVAEGQFCVLKEDNSQIFIGMGESFGESVLLLFGERSATVCASGCARAYGMEGMAVRELLSEQYEQRRRSVINAMDEVLNSNECELLSHLNGYQLQSLYDQVEMKCFEKGDVILTQGASTREVLVLCSGTVSILSYGVDMGTMQQFHLMGDRALVFQQQLRCEQPATLVATTPVETLVLKRSLLDQIFGNNLQQALVKNRILTLLNKHKVFARLHEEQREIVASACQIRSIPKGSEIHWKDVRFLTVLNGEVEMTRTDDASADDQRQLDGASSALIGPENLSQWDKQWAVQLVATTDSKLAVWRSEDLDSILAFNDFDFALEQEDKVRILQSVFIFGTLSKQQLQRLAKALDTRYVKEGQRVFSQGDIGTHFYIIRKGVVLVEIDGRKKRTLGIGDYFGERALLGSEKRSASITASEDTELWKMGKETFQEIMQGPCLDYLTARISLQDTKLTFQDLEFMRVIGRGGFGVVKMVRARHTGVRYALKCVRKRDVVEKNVQDALVSELSIMAEVDHPFIIKFVRSFRNESRVYFLMELVSGGELLDALDSLGLLKHSQALFYTGCIVLALEFLHARRIAYLDLKSENCLIDQQGYLKLIDFGIARRITKTSYGPLKGTPMFMAPEMILGKGHTTVADLWSLGICLYEFVIGNFPFANNCSNHGQIFHEILRAELRFPHWFEKVPMADEIMGLIRGLLTRDPQKRLGAGIEGYVKLKAQPFFRDFCWEKLLSRGLKPPFVPTNETYAEDKEKGASRTNTETGLPTVEEEEAQCQEEEDWQDPEPGWDADF
eukprot:TRINITY_DN3876_c0_g1_i7.p1 TRINITY_DN3876_c0_g1~~TRINITY_DN3876_c0_g1_i7.p1  ORF type:complete len:1126 (+),score=253.50 TRINITY_DN3876_c0_g1_i7:910-4287(+)